MENLANEAKYASVFQSAFENASLGIVISSRTKRYNIVNRAFVQLIGYSKEELLTMSMEVLTHPDDLPRNKDLIEQLLKRQIQSYDFEKRFVRKDGKPVWVNVH